MKAIKAKKDFVLEGKPYIMGDEVNTKDMNLIKRLNEKGFIEPLSYRDLVLIERDLNKPFKKEEVKDDTK